jgi:hypothetical protein
MFAHTASQGPDVTASTYTDVMPSVRIDFTALHHSARYDATTRGDVTKTTRKASGKHALGRQSHQSMMPLYTKGGSKPEPTVRRVRMTSSGSVASCWHKPASVPDCGSRQHATLQEHRSLRPTQRRIRQDATAKMRRQNITTTSRSARCAGSLRVRSCRKNAEDRNSPASAATSSGDARQAPPAP